MRELSGETSSNPDVVEYMLCNKFRCLPSQLEHEDAKKIDKFLAIENEFEIQRKNQQKMDEAEQKLKEMMGK
jgi:hypothetical protein